MTYAHRLFPIQRDALLLLGGIMLLLLSIWVAVSFGVTFVGGGAMAPWALALLFAGFLAFGASAVWWYHVYGDEREPARGEFTFDEANRARGGHGSFRTKALHAGALAEPQARMTSEAGFVPRTARRWGAWVAVVVLALVGAAALVGLSRTVEDPLAPLMVAVGLIGGAVMLGAVAVGEMGPRGAWFRREPPRAMP